MPRRSALHPSRPAHLAHFILTLPYPHPTRTQPTPYPYPYLYPYH